MRLTQEQIRGIMEKVTTKKQKEQEWIEAMNRDDKTQVNILFKELCKLDNSTKIG